MMPRSLHLTLLASLAALGLAGYALAGPPRHEHPHHRSTSTVTVTTPAETITAPGQTQTITIPSPAVSSSAAATSSSSSAATVVVNIPASTVERTVVVKMVRRVVRVRRYCTRQRHGWRCTPTRP